MQKRSCFHREFLITLGKRSGLQALIAGLKCARDEQRADVVGGKLLGIQCDFQFVLLASEQRGFRNIFYLLHILLHFASDPPERRAIVVFAPEGHRQHRDIVDRAGFDQRLADALRDAVEIREELVVCADNRVFFLKAHIEPDDDQGAAGLAG